MNWRGRKVVIIGAARQGLALARYLVQHGAGVLLNDRKSLPELEEAVQSLADLPVGSVTWVCGGHPFEVLDGADLLCPSGGVSLQMPLVQEAVRRGIQLSNDSQIFLEAAPCPVIGITGSAGKTTTTTLVGRMAHQASTLAGSQGNQGYFCPHQAWVGGNIGSPLVSVVDEMKADDQAVMELSSFQLEIMTRSPQVAAILNITPNHLDRHASMEAYTAAKSRILTNQMPGDQAILSREDPGAWITRHLVKGSLWSFGRQELADGEQGTFVRQGKVMLKTSSGEQALLEQNEIALRGEHNLLNVLAACAIAAAAGLPPEAMRQGVAGFTGVPHRLEFVREYHGSAWYNDSIATAPERSMAAIRSFSEPLVLLAGGRDKNLPWEDFARLAVQRVDHLILFGEAAVKIRQAVEAAGSSDSEQSCSVSMASGLQEAVQVAARLAEPGDVVLLSPGGTSFDEFRDFEQRGEVYRKWVMSLT